MCRLTRSLPSSVTDSSRPTSVATSLSSGSGSPRTARPRHSIIPSGSPAQTLGEKAKLEDLQSLFGFKDAKSGVM